MSIRTSYKISIPTPSGFVGRRCSNLDCKKYFKISSANIQADIICPYCGTQSPIADTWTQEQADYAVNVVKEEVMHDMVGELSKVFKNATRGSKFLKFKAKPHFKRIISPPKEYQVDNELQCSECSSRFQVDGIFGYCPVCRYENINIYDANFEIIKTEIQNSLDKERALRHAYGDLVSTFEDFCKKYAEDDAKANFQNLNNAKQYFKRQLNVDIYNGFTNSEKTSIKRVFMKRHIYVHPDGKNKGIIGDKYVQEIPEDKLLMGSKAELSIEELELGANLLRRIIANFINSKLHG